MGWKPGRMALSWDPLNIGSLSLGQGLKELREVECLEVCRPRVVPSTRANVSDSPFLSPLRMTR